MIGHPAAQLMLFLAELVQTFCELRLGALESELEKATTVHFTKKTLGKTCLPPLTVPTRTITSKISKNENRRKRA